MTKVSLGGFSVVSLAVVLAVVLAGCNKDDFEFDFFKKKVKHTIIRELGDDVEYRAAVKAISDTFDVYYQPDNLPVDTPDGHMTYDGGIIVDNGFFDVSPAGEWKRSSAGNMYYKHADKGSRKDFFHPAERWPFIGGKGHAELKKRFIEPLAFGVCNIESYEYYPYDPELHIKPKGIDAERGTKLRTDIANGARKVGIVGYVTLGISMAWYDTLDGYFVANDLEFKYYVKEDGSLRLSGIWDSERLNDSEAWNKQTRPLTYLSIGWTEGKKIRWDSIYNATSRGVNNYGCKADVIPYRDAFRAEVEKRGFNKVVYPKEPDYAGGDGDLRSLPPFYERLEAKHESRYGRLNPGPYEKMDYELIGFTHNRLSFTEKARLAVLVAENKEREKKAKK